MGKLQFRTFERKPFRVEAVKITEENIDEIGELIGEVRIHRRTKHKFIITNPKIVSEVGMVYIGWYLTRFKGRYRCYKPIAFEKEFIRVRKRGNYLRPGEAKQERQVATSDPEEMDRPISMNHF